MISIPQRQALIDDIINAYHNDKVKNTNTCGMRKVNVSALVLSCGLLFPSTLGISAMLKNNTHIANTISCQLLIQPV